MEKRTRAGILCELLLTFMKVGFFTFGGGYAMISVLEDICVEKKNWITHDDMMNITVIAESTPGPVAINCATFIGCKQAGFAGALAATFGVVFPSFLVIYIISMFLDHFLEIAVIANAFKGIRIAVGILILRVGIKMSKSAGKTLLAYTILAAAFIAMLLISIFAWNFSSIALLLIAAVIGLAAEAIRKERAGK